jgi:hypothetical protein
MLVHKNLRELQYLSGAKRRDADDEGGGGQGGGQSKARGFTKI